MAQRHRARKTLPDIPQSSECVIIVQSANGLNVKRYQRGNNRFWHRQQPASSMQYLSMTPFLTVIVIMPFLWQSAKSAFPLDTADRIVRNIKCRVMTVLHTRPRSQRRGRFCTATKLFFSRHGCCGSVGHYSRSSGSSPIASLWCHLFRRISADDRHWHSWRHDSSEWTITDWRASSGKGGFIPRRGRMIWHGDGNPRNRWCADSGRFIQVRHQTIDQSTGRRCHPGYVVRPGIYRRAAYLQFAVRNSCIHAFAAASLCSTAGDIIFTCRNSVGVAQVVHENFCRIFRWRQRIW